MQKHIPLAFALFVTAAVVVTITTATQPKNVKTEPTIFEMAQSQLTKFHTVIIAERADEIKARAAAPAKK